MDYSKLNDYYCTHCKCIVKPWDMETTGTTKNKKWKHLKCNKTEIIRIKKEPPAPERVEDLFE